MDREIRTLIEDAANVVYLTGDAMNGGDNHYRISDREEDEKSGLVEMDGRVGDLLHSRLSRPNSQQALERRSPGTDPETITEIAPDPFNHIEKCSVYIDTL